MRKKIVILVVVVVVIVVAILGARIVVSNFNVVDFIKKLHGS